MILLLVCIGSVGYFLDKLPDNGDLKKEDYLKVFVGAAAAAAIIALLFFLIFLAGLHTKIEGIKWPKTAAVVFLILAILLLVGSALLADAVKYYDDEKLCKALDEGDFKSQCAQLFAGAACGFLAMIAFVVDGVVHFKLE